jgi:hypothetical protein
MPGKANTISAGRNVSIKPPPVATDESNLDSPPKHARQVNATGGEG